MYHRRNMMLAGGVMLAIAVILLLVGAPVASLLFALVAAGIFWASTMGAEKDVPRSPPSPHTG
jgi:hypothetical protein